MATDSGLDDLLAAAKATLKRVKSLITQIGWKYIDLSEAPIPIGVGIAVSFGDTRYTVLSVMGGGSENQLNIAAGILCNIQQDHLTVLSLCNGMTRDNPAYPIYLHDAPIGWDILVANTFPVRMLFESPTFFANTVHGLPLVAEKARPQFLEAKLGGQPFNWNDADLNRLFQVSML